MEEGPGSAKPELVLNPSSLFQDLWCCGLTGSSLGAPKRGLGLWKLGTYSLMVTGLLPLVPSEPGFPDAILGLGSWCPGPGFLEPCGVD